MIRPSRLPLLAALATFLLHGALALALFPRDLQLHKYPRAAARLLSGALAPERLLDFSPFYLYLHAGLGGLLGGGRAPGGEATVAVVVALQILAVSAASALLLLLLRRFFPTWIAVAGTAAFILSRGVVVYAPVLEPEPFLLLFLVAFLYFAFSVRPGRLLLAGLALALALSIRPSVLPLLAVVPLHFFLNGVSRSWLVRSALVVAPSLLVLLALGARNAAVSGRPLSLGMNPGFVFFEGNNPLSSGRSAVYPPLVGELRYEMGDEPDSPHIGYRLLAARSLGRETTSAEANRYWRGRALAFIADHPLRFASLLATKAYFTFHQYRRHDLVPAQRFDRRVRWMPSLPFALLAALALAGALLRLRDWRPLLLIYALFASQALVMLLLYVSERQRLPLVPVFVFFACAAVARLAAAERRRRVTLLAACAVLTGVFALPNDLTREERHLWASSAVREQVWRRAFLLRDQGRLAEAEQHAALGYAAAPWLEDYSRPSGLRFAPQGFAARALETLAPDDPHPSRRLDRAQLLLAAGRLEEAEALLRRIVADGRRFDRGFFQSSQPRHHLARTLAEGGMRGQAVELLEQALARAPGDPFVLAQLAALTGEDAYRRTIVRYFGELHASFLVGLAELEHGVGDHGAAKLTETARGLPELWRARIYLAAALGAQGDGERARAVYREAMAERNDPALLEVRIVPIFAAAARGAPDDASARHEHGLVLAQFGRFDEALIELRAALAAEARPELERAIAEAEWMRARAP